MLRTDPAKFSSDTLKSLLSEEDIPALVEALGPENVLAGSDWPHPEGCAEPIDYVEGLEGLSPEVVRAVMRDNTQKLFGV